ncbi:uncharacterized protein LOC134835138 [Culicoides brevitarsis]|uniref:uncharacterized protein LOC134835138 n=1 Tax=Culicoides brevitarsis TaxID=469753 RepID=UPI00307CA655
MQLATTDLEAETNQNITETQEEFFAMCEDSEDADNITQTVNNVTTKITECVQTSTSVTVQMCANVAIQALLVKQTTAHQQIGHCVSEGKAENEKDMNEIKESFKQSCSHNHEQLKHCADKHKPGPGPHKRGPASDSDSGETPAEKCESCKKKHCDKGKAHKEHSHEKCKKHKKGGEHHEKVKKCKKDSRTTTITEIQAIVATFNICASVTITL